MRIGAKPMPLGKHEYLGKQEGKMARFLSKLTTVAERKIMRKKLKYAYKKIDDEKKEAIGKPDSKHAV